MKRKVRALAEQGVRLLESALKQSPPRGVGAEEVAGFFKQHRTQLEIELAGHLQKAIGLHKGVDETKASCGCNHAEDAAIPPVKEPNRPRRKWS